MIARITKTLFLVQLAMLMMFYLLLTHLWPFATPLPAVWNLILSLGLVGVCRAMIVANNFFMTWPTRDMNVAAQNLNWMQFTRLFFGEFNASMLCSCWGMPFKRFDEKLVADNITLPVLLIHGYGCNSGYWHWMSKAFQKAGITHSALDMEPLFGSIDAYAPLVHAAVERLCQQTGQARVVLVAHSMGGLAARAYLRAHGSARIARIITLGTPHHGTTLANKGYGINCREMNWVGPIKDGGGSPWLRMLAESESPQMRALTVSIYSHHDNIISPQRSSLLDGAQNIGVSGIGHVALALHPKIQALVIKKIREVSP
ncbi:alpha/beta fold hydrolase [Herbaspirillum sp. RTI4]|uniref:esterase/lipase family protein n=1 Tax=Herbaspirillum sp. RTI4 TaxID=3048640 RepID=UPI002AB46F08|nr:alpha/beta fold hydrolase [Herbaspirillum sp. RTI4]MDY7578449.1 alpha/beta fold hydrolase [Herbaspirillum sp. RTI4]MEA9982537.1 alpha/beta fold hydrolase [Herbaspirillum sp. RTI4]